MITSKRRKAPSAKPKNPRRVLKVWGHVSGSR
jgi:hypothetical protein